MKHTSPHTKLILANMNVNCIVKRLLFTTDLRGVIVLNQATASADVF